MIITIDSTIQLTSHKDSDAADLALRINDKRIADNTLTIPYPYSMDNAELFIETCIAQQNGSGLRNWAIRSVDEGLIGGIGMHFKYGAASHKDEIGYWLTPDHWGKGLMTRVVKKFVNFIVSTRSLSRIEAPVFLKNIASARVLEKNGFEREGILRNCYRKNNTDHDAVLYAKVFNH